MGKLWQKTDNAALNAPLEQLKIRIGSRTAAAEEFLTAIKSAKDIAVSQNLERTARQLALFEKSPALDADLQDADKAAAIVKNIDRIIRNAQVAEVDQASIKIAHPTLVYLSGFLTNNDRNDYVLGSIRRMEELFRDRPEVKAQPDVYAWTHTDLKNLFNLAAYNTCPGSRSSSAGYDLGAAIIMPLVAENFARDSQGNVTGTPLPLAQARNNLKNITLFGYSAGSIVAQETFNATMKMMKKIGFDEKAARAALKEIVLITVGNISRPTKELDRYTTLTLVASNDRIMRLKNWLWGTLGATFKKLKQYLTLQGWHKNDKELTIRPLSEDNLFISASVRNSLYEWNYDADGNRLAKRPFDPLLPEWTLIRSYHEIPHYITMDASNNAFAGIAHYALVNAFNRQSRLSPLELIEPSPDDTHSPQAQAEYRQRITDALRPTPRALRG